MEIYHRLLSFNWLDVAIPNYRDHTATCPALCPGALAEQDLLRHVIADDIINAVSTNL